MADTTSVRVTRGMALLLGDLPELTYRPPGEAFLDSEAPITFGSQHPTIARCVTVTPYLDLPTDSQAAYQLVQVRTRWSDYLGGLALTDSIRDLFHDRRYVDLDGVTASRVRLDSFAPLGPDKSGRHEWTQNFRLLLSRPAAQHRPYEGTPTA